jgi:alpha-ketoglutarate-dependent taurine dioxygenase
MSTSEKGTPFVIEPSGFSSVAFLSEFLRAHSAQILADLTAHGAILLRGFQVASATSFEEVVLSIQGMWGMEELLLSEPGRTLADGARFVMYTNSLVKTGGSIGFDAFHSENYFAPDVPGYASFFCLTPSSFGGETGLLNLSKLYADLPNQLKLKLEGKACFVARYALADMERRYRLCARVIEGFCADAGLPTVSVDGARYVAVYKPSVVRHPVTQEKTLLINFLKFATLREALLREFLPDYAGNKWCLHRLIWRSPLLSSLTDPDGRMRALFRRMRYPAARASGSEACLTMDGALFVESLFPSSDVQVLAGLMRRRYSSFLWKKGDVLIVDNLQLGHAGMPGHGKRDLRVMLCNPVPLPCSESSPGLQSLSENGEARASLGARLLALRNAGISSLEKCTNIGC